MYQQCRQYVKLTAPAYSRYMCEQCIYLVLVFIASGQKVSTLVPPQWGTVVCTLVSLWQCAMVSKFSTALQGCYVVQYCFQGCYVFILQWEGNLFVSQKVPFRGWWYGMHLRGSRGYHTHFLQYRGQQLDLVGRQKQRYLSSSQDIYQLGTILGRRDGQCQFYRPRWFQFRQPITLVPRYMRARGVRRTVDWQLLYLMQSGSL